jgi:hypothetical protein
LKLLDIKEDDLPEGLKNSFSSDLMKIITESGKDFLKVVKAVERRLIEMKN